MAIKAVIFDFGGVLCTDLSNRMNKEIYRGTKYYHKNEPKSFIFLLHKFSKNKISEKEFFEKSSKIIGKSPELLRSIWKKWASKTKERKRMVNLLEKLKRKGYKIVVLSNTNPIHYKIHVRQGQYDRFDVKIISNKVKDRKPNKSIYRLALRKLRMNPNEVIFIDDLERNIRPAKNLGINTILYKSFPQVIKELKKLDVKF